jgi:endonuclease G
VGVSATRLHYRSATEPGSSGSPVFNDLWQLIGLHHYGGTLHRLEPGRTEETYEANEGIALRAIVADVEQQRTRPPVPGR